MRYTKSKDGKERATIRLSIRLDREQIEAAQLLAKQYGKPWRAMLSDWAKPCIADEIVETTLDEWK